MEMLKKTIYKKWCLWVILVLVVGGTVGCMSENYDSATNNNETTTEGSKETSKKEDVKAKRSKKKKSKKTKPTKAPTLGQVNALQKAEAYLDMGGFSKKGLTDQLKFEGFTGKEISYAVKNCSANWKKQAVIKAQAYIDMGGFSKQSLIDQLKFEGFTIAQCNYAVKKVGY